MYENLTQDLTQNRNILCGNSGANDIKENSTVGQTVSKGARKYPIYTLRQATDQKAGGPKPSGRTKSTEIR